MEFQINGRITSADDAEMLDTLSWLKDNYGTKIHDANGNGETKVTQFNIVESTFNDNVTSIMALKTQFGARLNWNFTMNR